MIHRKSNKEIDLLRASADLVGRALAEVARHVAPGVTTGELDEVAEDFIRTHDASPAFKGHAHGSHIFPGTLCTSINDEVVHGIPGDRKLEDGDLLSVDCGVILDGYVGDSAYTFAVGSLSDADAELCAVTHEGLLKGIEQCSADNRVGDVGHAVESVCTGYGIVRDLCGHGVGKKLWEEPQVPNFGDPGRGRKLKPGLVICIEPMITTGAEAVMTDDDGWTVRTTDGSRAAHYEHMVAITKDGPEVLSTFDYIEEIVDAPYKKLATHG